MLFLGHTGNLTGVFYSFRYVSTKVKLSRAGKFRGVIASLRSIILKDEYTLTEKWLMRADSPKQLYPLLSKHLT